MWIRRLNCGPGKGLNEDWGSKLMHGHLYSRRCDLWGWGAMDLFLTSILNSG